MFAKQEMHCILCDECKKIFVNADGEAFFNSQEAAEQELDSTVIDKDGTELPCWEEEDGKHYCPECAKKLGIVCGGDCDDCQEVCPANGTDAPASGDGYPANDTDESSAD